MMDSLPGCSTSEEIFISRKTLIEYYNECKNRLSNEKNSHLFAKVAEALRMDELTNDIKTILRKLVSDYKIKLQVAHRNVTRCFIKNKDWFDAYITFPVPHTRTSSCSSGRPSKNFRECTERTKRRKTEIIRKQNDPAELVFAAQVEYRTRGEMDTAKALKKLMSGDFHETLSADKALSLVIEAKLSKFQYNLIRENAKEMSCSLYPAYETITEAKKRCYPEGITCSETEARVPLQSLINHTTERLFMSLTNVLHRLEEDQRQKLCLLSKWGCDGSGSHSVYKQLFVDTSKSDANMFITSLVPIRLIIGKADDPNAIIVWQNPRPSSPRYCRPIQLQMDHETPELSILVAQDMQKQIDNLLPAEINVDDIHYKVSHHLMMTMVDGKMVNSLTETKSAQRCYLCGLTSKEFNNIKLCYEKTIQENHLSYGISSLHAWIRFAEYILHLGYKMKIAKWQCRKKTDKQIEQKEKKRIQKEFFERLGLVVDKPKTGGGTSTDGNTARRLFENPKTVSEITGVSHAIIKNLHTILLTISSGYKIKLEKFRIFCKRLAAELIHTYPWYYIPTTVHKILIHGPQIIDFSDIAIGLLSEDAQESRNKDVRRYREQFSRKFTRELTMTDTFNRLLCSSDPYITGLRKLVPKKNISLPEYVLRFLEE